MGSWGYVAFVRATPFAVRDALVQLLAAERRTPVPAPPPRDPPRYDPMQYGDGGACALWGVALLPAQNGFCLLQTAPPELLAESAGAGSRLASLCRALGEPGFVLCLYDGIGLVLFEADAGGGTSLGGIGDPSRDPTEWNGMTIERFEPGFERVDVPEAVRAAVRADNPEDAFGRVATELLGADAPAAADHLALRYLVPHQPLPLDGAVALYFAREQTEPAREPLPVELREVTFPPEEPRQVLEPEPYGGWPAHRRLLVRGGGGELWLTGTALEAPDSRLGGLFLDHLAGWLGVSAPAPAEPPGLLSPVFCLLDPVEGGYALRLGDEAPAELRLRIDGERGELTEADPAQRERLLALLAPAVRDGPGGGGEAPLVAHWQRATDDPAYVAGAGFVGEQLWWASWHGNKRSAVHRLSLDTGSLDDPGLLEGLVSSFSARGGAVFALAAHPSRALPSPGIASDAPARVVAIDPATGSTHELETDFDVASFSPLVVAPDAAAVALEARRPGKPGRPRVVDAESGVTLAAFEVPGLTPVAWDARGLVLVLHDFAAGGPSRWFRWDGASLEEVEERYYAPDGRQSLSVEADGLYARRPSGEVRVGTGPASVTGVSRGPVWMGGDAILIRGSRPEVLSLSGEGVRPLAPPARDLDPVAATEDGRSVAAFVGQGRLFWGRALDA